MITASADSDDVMTPSACNRHSALSAADSIRMSRRLAKYTTALTTTPPCRSISQAASASVFDNPDANNSSVKALDISAIVEVQSGVLTSNQRSHKTIDYHFMACVRQQLIC